MGRQQDLFFMTRMDLLMDGCGPTFMEWMMDVKVVSQELLLQIHPLFGNGTAEQVAEQVRSKDKESILQTPKQYRLNWTYSMQAHTPLQLL